MAAKRKYPPTEDLAHEIEALLWMNGDRYALTIADIQDIVSRNHRLDIPLGNLRKAIHYHRMNLSSETGALIVEIVGKTHVYSITADAERIKEWVISRERDLDTRVRTIHAQAEVAARVTSKNSREGRRARLERKLLGRLMEDLSEHFEQVEPVTA